jgi:hypothetical protein
MEVPTVAGGMTAESAHGGHSVRQAMPSMPLQAAAVPQECAHHVHPLDHRLIKQGDVGAGVDEDFRVGLGVSECSEVAEAPGSLTSSGIRRAAGALPAANRCSASRLRRSSSSSRHSRMRAMLERAGLEATSSNAR